MKKIIAFCMVFILSFCCLPVLSFAYQVPDNFPTQIPFSIYQRIVTFYQEMNGDVIESIITDTGLVSPFTNGSDLLMPLVLSDCTIFNLQFGFTFSDPSYINGQSYKFEFTSNIDDLFISSYIPLENVAAIASVDYALLRAIDQFQIGDSFHEVTLYRHAYGYLNGIDSDIDCRYSEHTNRFSLEFTFSDNYTFNELNSQNSNNIDLAFLIVMRNDSANQISFNDITFSPVGATKQLYSDEVFQNGILNGFQDLEDQMSDVNQNLDDIEGILNGEGETYAPLPEESYFNEYHEAESEYNKDFSGELDDLIGDADGIFDGSSSFSFITSIFDDIIVSNSKINGLILFCLSLGLCVLILGRRLNSA